MKNQWKKKAKRKHLRSSTKSLPKASRVGEIARGKGIAEESELRSIIDIMLKDIVDQGGTISLNVEDGRLSISGETSGIDLCDVTDQEAKQ